MRIKLDHAHKMLSIVPALQELRGQSLFLSLHHLKLNR